MLHHSKKDWWLIGAVSSAVVIPLGLGIFLLRFGSQYRTVGAALAIDGAITALVILLLTYPLYYQITSAELIVRCGVLMNRHIPLGAIDEVRPDRNPASAPAWSLDRLRADYRKNGEHAFIMISPEDKDAFMEELAKAAPGLEMRGDRLVRKCVGAIWFQALLIAGSQCMI